MKKVEVCERRNLGFDTIVNSIHLNMYTRRKNKDDVNKVLFEDSTHINCRIPYILLSGKKELNFWYNTTRDVLKIASEYFTKKRVIINIPGEMDSYQDQDFLFDHILNYRAFGIIQALTEYQNRNDVYFITGYIKEKMGIKLLQVSDLAFNSFNNDVKQCTNKHYAFNDDFINEMTTLISKSLNINFNKIENVNHINDFYEPINSFFYTNKKILYGENEVTYASYNASTKKIIVYLPAILNNSLNYIDYNMSYIATLAHEMRHHWQNLNNFSNDGTSIDYKYRKQEIDARRFATDFIRNHKKKILKSIKKHFYKKFKFSHNSKIKFCAECSIDFYRSVERYWKKRN